MSHTRGEDSGVGVAELAGPDAPASLAALRATQPAAWIDAVQGWLVTSYDLAIEVMRDAVTFTVDDPRFSTATVLGASMLSLDGAAHRRHRAPFVAPFRPNQVEQRFGADVERVARELVARIRPNRQAELRTEVAGPLSVAVIATLLGLRDVDTARVLGWYAAIVHSVSAISAGEPAGDAAPVAFDELAVEVRRGLADGDSILTRATSSLDEADIVANAAVMMFGGIETVEGMIANAMLHLLEHPATLERVRADASLTAAAVEESLRLQPAAAVVDRYATATTTLGPATINRGDLVRVSITGANRDPDVFPDPDRYDIERANVRSQLAFARGPHVCIAMDLARLETRVAIRVLLDTLPGLRLAAPSAVHGLIFRKPITLAAAWDEG